MTTTRVPASSTEPPQARFNRPVFMGNIVSGALWLLGLAFVSWPLSLIGAVYVAIGSVFLAAVYGRQELTRRQEALAWATPWLVAVGIWTWLGAVIEDGASNWLLTLWFGLVIATPCYLAWQFSALAVRQVLAWRSRTAASRR